MNITDIINQAEQNNICQEWAKLMKQNPTVKNLCEMFFNGSDWATEHDFPTPEMVKAFPECKHYGLFADADYKGEAMEQMAFFGESRAEITAKQFDVVGIYIRHKTKVHIKAKDWSKVFVYQYDDAEVTFEKDSRANVRILKY